MANKFVTSDNHFYHQNILKFQKEAGTRPFETLGEMHEKMIERWNTTVREYDTVYILGDFSFGSWEQTKEILYQLNGVKHLIEGNHDRTWLNPQAKKYFASMQSYLEYRHKSLHVVMSHYPFAQWNRMQYGALHFHGHTHGNYKAKGRIMDAGIDNRPNKDYNLWAWDELVDLLLTKEILKHHENTN